MSADRDRTFETRRIARLKSSERSKRHTRNSFMLKRSKTWVAECIIKSKLLTDPSMRFIIQSLRSERGKELLASNEHLHSTCRQQFIPGSEDGYFRPKALCYIHFINNVEEKTEFNFII